MATIKRKPKEPTTPAPSVTPPIPESKPAATLGSYGNASIDQWDAAFLAASDAVMQKKGIRVDPHFMKGVMDVESGGNGNYPANKCRPADGTDHVPACGPMQIKQHYHQARCPECDFTTVPGQIELATHIIGDFMKKLGVDEYHALVAPGSYFPEDDVNGTTQAAYVTRVRSLVATMTGGVTPTPLDPWRPYPYPKMVDLLVTKPAEGAGFDRVTFRRPRVRGFATHITDGPPSQTIEFFQGFFGTGGQRAWDALTDLVIGWDGRIGLLNDWRDPNRGGTRAGWANGGVDGLEGEGVAFYRAFPDINSCLVSAEHTQQAGGQWSDAMLASTIEIRTAIAQELKCPWDAYPYHPAYNGVSIEQQHRNFATKSCPANPYISTYDTVVKREVKAKLKAWQGGQPGEPVPEPHPVWYTRFGFSLQDIQTFFGTITRYNQDGTTDEFGFDTEGALSLLWLNRCDKEGTFPEAERIWYADAQFVDGTEIYGSFEGGWTCYLPLEDSRASWRWLDDEPANG